MLLRKKKPLMDSQVININTWHVMKNLSKVCLNGMECDTIHKFSLPLQALVLAATMLGYVKLC